MIQRLGMLVLKTGPNGLQKWSLYLTSACTSLSRASSGWPRALRHGADHSMWFQHGGQDSMCPTASWSPFNPREIETAGQSTQPCLGGRRTQARHVGALLLVFLSHLIPSPRSAPASGGTRLCVLTCYSHRQLHEGGDRLSRREGTSPGRWWWQRFPP